MLRIGASSTGVDLLAQQAVRNAYQQTAESSLRLATLKRINRGSDDPAGLIAAEMLHREITAMEEAIGSAERSRALMNVADSGLGRASELLRNIDANLVAAAGNTVSEAEKQALQLEIDASLDALDRIGQTTTFAGRQVFDGNPASFLVGSHPDDLATLTLPEVNSGSLGGTSGSLGELRSGGAASATDGNPALAADILSDAQQQILASRAEVGAFERYTIDTTQQILSDTMVNLSSAYSQISDTDVALETANHTRNLILADAAIFAAGQTLASRNSAVILLSNSGDT